jgi:hypothetical protein
MLYILKIKWADAHEQKLVFTDIDLALKEFRFHAESSQIDELSMTALSADQIIETLG